MIKVTPVRLSRRHKTTVLPQHRQTDNTLLQAMLTCGHLLTEQDTSKALQHLLGSLLSVLSCDTIHLFQASESNHTLTGIASAGTPPPLQSFRFLIPEHTLVLSSPKTIATKLGPLHDVFPPTTTQVLLIPLHVPSGCIGMLGLSTSHHRFSHAERAATVGIAGIIGRLLEGQYLEAHRRRTAERQRMLDHVRHHLQRTLDLNELIARIFEEVDTAIQTEAQSIWLVDEKASLLRCRFATGPQADTVKQISVPLGEGIVGNTVARKESYLIPDVQSDGRHFRRADHQTGMSTRTLISVPIVREGRAIGAIQALNKRNDGTFTCSDLELLQSIADIAALAIENARLYAELEQSYDTTLQALTNTLDARDHETEGHSRRVVEYVVRLGTEIGVTGSELRILRRGALLHDIGKIGIPDAILHKPGPLTMEERRIMQKHPLIGYEMLRGVSHLTQEVEIVLSHQERWDGTGYPFGLKGEEIPLYARLFAIADTFDAILSDRPYRKGRPYAVARDIIVAESGKQFDPALVEVFLAVPPAEWEHIRLRSWL